MPWAYPHDAGPIISISFWRLSSLEAYQSTDALRGISSCIMPGYYLSFFADNGEGGLGLLTRAARSISPDSRPGAKTPRSAGTGGDAAQWGGSSAAEGWRRAFPLAKDASWHLIAYLAIWRVICHIYAK